MTRFRSARLLGAVTLLAGTVVIASACGSGDDGPSQQTVTVTASPSSDAVAGGSASTAAQSTDATTTDAPTTEAPTTGRGLGAPGRYTIKQSNNDCDPSCAGGTLTSKILRWNGSDYVG